MMIMPLKYYDAAASPADPHLGPSVVKYGGEWMAVWSLVGMNLWVADAHSTFNGPDASANFTFPDSEIGCDPSPIDMDAGWASLKWFAKLENLLTSTPTSLSINPAKVTSEIRLTQGTGGGRAPASICERYRKHKVGTDPGRTFATQMHVVYPHAAGHL